MADNIFGNWGQIDRMANKPAIDWTTQKMNEIGIKDPNVKDEPITVPYNPGTVVVQQPAVQQQTGGKEFVGQRNDAVKKIDPTSSTDGMDLLSSMYTTPQQEEKYRKAAVANQRIMAVADALRHIGNIYNTVNYAPAQKLNNPVAEEADRYLKGKAMRDNANMRYLSYQQQKANQEARIRQAEAQMRYNMEKDARDYQLKKNESDARANYNEARIQRQQALIALDEARMKGQITENEYKALRNKYYPEVQQSVIARNNRTGSGRSGGSGSRQTQWQTTYRDFDYANQNGIPIMEVKTDIFGNKTTGRKDPNVVHAEVEEHKRKTNNGGSSQPKKRSSGIK